MRLPWRRRKVEIERGAWPCKPIAGNLLSLSMTAPIETPEGWKRTDDTGRHFHRVADGSDLDEPRIRFTAAP